MISLAFILTFIFCLAIAAGGILISHQLITTYNADFHRNYFYYLVTFYSFAFYGIWGQILMRALLFSWQTKIEIVEAIAGFLPILGVPFLLISWVMLFKLSYSLFGLKLKTHWLLIHFIFPALFITVSWFTVDYFIHDDLLINKNLKYIETGLLISFELIYVLAFTVIVMYHLQKMRHHNTKFIVRFAWLMIAGFIIRGTLLPFAFMAQWAILPVILFYFASNLPPLIYLRSNAELMFKPVFVENPSENKMKLIFERYKISKREREIIRQICEGKTNRQIADELFISLQTVKDHTHRIYSKIGINSRMHLVQMVNN